MDRPHAKLGGQVDLAAHRLAHRNEDQRTVQLLGLRARDSQPHQLPLEAIAFSGQFDRHEWPAACRRRRRVDLQPEIGKHIPQFAGFAFVAFLNLRKRLRLASFDVLKRGFCAREFRGNVAAFAGFTACLHPIGVEERLAVATGRCGKSSPPSRRAPMA